MRLLHLQFRFTEPDDVARFGDGWWDYDENRIVRLPARRLIELEQDLGIKIAAAMNEFRADGIMGDLACTWLALHLADPDRAGAFADYSPVVMLTDWRSPGVPEDGITPPLDPTPTPDSTDGQVPEQQ